MRGVRGREELRGEFPDMRMSFGKEEREGKDFRRGVRGGAGEEELRTDNSEGVTGGVSRTVGGNRIGIRGLVWVGAEAEGVSEDPTTVEEDNGEGFESLEESAEDLIGSREGLEGSAGDLAGSREGFEGSVDNLVGSSERFEESVEVDGPTERLEGSAFSSEESLEARGGRDREGEGAGEVEEGGEGGEERGVGGFRELGRLGRERRSWSGADRSGRGVRCTTCSARSAQHCVNLSISISIS
jgi:hypothetical protein